jgi:hypothetical protein
MSQESNKTSATADAKNTGKEEEIIPILELTGASKDGSTPNDVVNSLRILAEDNADLKLLLPDGVAQPPVNIVKNADLPSDPKWRVLVTLSNDHLPENTVIKGKVYQKYVCINAQLSFYKETKEHLLSEDIISGVWLLPIKVRKEGEEGEKKAGANQASYVVLAYVRVKIVDEADTLSTGEAPTTSKSALDTQDTSKKV